MKAEVIPALLAAGGGSAMLGAVYAHEYRRDVQMRARREQFGVRFPAGISDAQAVAALGVLSGLPTHSEVIAELTAVSGRVSFGLHVDAASAGAVVASMSGVLGGLRRTYATASTGLVTVAVRLFVPRIALLRADDPAAAFRALVGGLGGLHPKEELVVRWALRPSPAPFELPVERTSISPTTQAAMRRKSGHGGFLAAGIVLVRAPSAARARTLANHVISSYRARQIGSYGLRPTFERGSRSLASLPRVARSSGWLSVPEILGLVAWPIGSDAMPGVELGAAREHVAPPSVPQKGRRLFVARDTRGAERPVALSPDAARHHLAVIGPSGSGKSELLARGILDDIAAGFGGTLVDPKRDLLEAVLQRVRPEDRDRMVVLDPTDKRPVPGLDVLGVGDADLRTDLLISVLRTIVPDWGIRSEIWGRSAFRTIGEVPGATLLDVGKLFTDPAFRRTAVGRLRDPLLIAQWQAFEAMGPGEQLAQAAAPMARVMALLSRPAVRAIVAQPQPKLNIPTLLRERRWLLVGLGPGVIGESAAGLIGALTMFAVWSAIEARVALPANRRHPLFLHIDELATLGQMPVALELLLERCRGLGVGLTVGLQSLGRVPEPGRSALLANAASLVTFRAARDEATRLSRELAVFSERDIQALGRFEVAARVATGIGSSGVIVTGRTEPLEPGDPAQSQAIRDESARRWGGEAELPQPTRQSTTAQSPQAGRTERPL